MTKGYFRRNRKLVQFMKSLGIENVYQIETEASEGLHEMETDYMKT